MQQSECPSVNLCHGQALNAEYITSAGHSDYSRPFTWRENCTHKLQCDKLPKSKGQIFQFYLEPFAAQCCCARKTFNTYWLKGSMNLFLNMVCSTQRWTRFGVMKTSRSEWRRSTHFLTYQTSPRPSSCQRYGSLNVKLCFSMQKWMIRAQNPPTYALPERSPQSPQNLVNDLGCFPASSNTKHVHAEDFSSLSLYFMVHKYSHHARRRCTARSS